MSLGELNHRPKMLSDGILSCGISESQCSVNSFSDGFIYHEVLVQIQNGARNGCSSRRKLTQDKSNQPLNLQNSKLSTMLKFQSLPLSLQTVPTQPLLGIFIHNSCHIHENSNPFSDPHRMHKTSVLSEYIRCFRSLLPKLLKVALKQNCWITW